MNYPQFLRITADTDGNYTLPADWTLCRPGVGATCIISDEAEPRELGWATQTPYTIRVNEGHAFRSWVPADTEAVPDTELLLCDMALHFPNQGDAEAAYAITQSYVDA